MPNREPFPTTWVRTGQVAFLQSHIHNRVQITGVTEDVHYRQWIPGRDGTELGAAGSLPRNEFERDWAPYYSSRQTRRGSQFLNVPQESIYNVVNDTPTQLILRSYHYPLDLAYHNGTFDIALTRYRVSPKEWLYIGPSLVDQPLQTSELPTPGVELLAPASRYDREDPL